MSAPGPSFGRRSAPTLVPLRPSAPPKSEPPPPPQPPASSAPEEAIIELRNICLARLDPTAVAAMPEDRLTADVERLISEIATERRIQLNAREQRALAGELVDDILGLGPMEPLLEDESVSEIMVNGPEKTFIERSGKLMLSHVRFRDTQHLSNICQRIAAAVGRRIDEASPMVDARLRDGSRVNIVFPPLALDGPYVTIRKFGRKTIDFDQLVEWKAMSRQVARILQIASQARLNVIISGGTGSGKTTLLNALSRMIAPGERVVTVEDTAELQLQQPHVVRLETRPASLEGKGEVTQRDLMKNALRMRPDRIIIGEVRGAEAFDMLQAMNTGHDGSMSTIHANTTRDAVTRIENMVQMGQMGLPSRAIRTQIVSAIELIVQVERQRDGGRRVTQVTEVCGMEGDVITLNDLFQFEVQGEGPNGKLFGRYNVTRLPPSFMRRLTYFGLDKAWKAALDEVES
ncbi:MAG TPA: CpaF family protein [Acetobacteraceae bacterium]|nr:CpaF family protein [Acetobacteraceae bacterium]